MNAPRPLDWLGVAFLVTVWGSAFALIKIGVGELAPATVTMGRLWLGAALLTAWALVRGHALPRLWPRPDPLWGWMAAMGVLGNALPFFLIAWGEQTVPAALAGIFMAVMPLATAALMIVFVPSETMDARRWLGFAMGFGGVVLLFAPSLMGEGSSATGGAIAQGAILLAALSYAFNTILTRRAPDVRPSVLAAGMLICAAVMATPFGLIGLGEKPIQSAAPVWAVIALGVGPTAAASIVYVGLIRSAGPGLVAMANYLIPVAAVGFGALLGETLRWTAFAALAVILLGVGLGARRAGPARQASTDAPAPRSGQA